MKTIIIALLSLGLLELIMIGIRVAGFGITYQASASMPRGFYFIIPAKHLIRGDQVVFTAPSSIIIFLRTHPWVPKNNRLLKYVVAAPGDAVCKKFDAIWINQRRFAPVYRDYAPHHALPNVPFCGTLKIGQYLLMSTRVAHSFDGRYFGPTEINDIAGKAIPLT